MLDKIKAAPLEDKGKAVRTNELRSQDAFPEELRANDPLNKRQPVGLWQRFVDTGVAGRCHGLCGTGQILGTEFRVELRLSDPVQGILEIP